MTTTALALLLAGRELIADPERHATGALARDRTGMKVHPAAPWACRWCGLGALVSVTEKYVGPGEIDSARNQATELLNAAAYEVEPDPFPIVDPVLKSRHVAFLNDGPDGHRKVISAYDIAIERARAKEAGS
jgi:hypothetical protein